MIDIEFVDLTRVPPASISANPYQTTRQETARGKGMLVHTCSSYTQVTTCIPRMSRACLCINLNNGWSVKCIVVSHILILWRLHV
jgi:hypothetical protein